MILSQATIEYLPVTDNSIDLVFTDPPYAKEYLPCYEWLAREAARVLKPGGFVFAMAGGMYLDKIYAMFSAMQELKYFWEFHHKSNGDAPYIWPKKVVAKSKVILCYCKGDGAPRTNVISIFESAKESKRWHEWGQDIESARYYIDCFSKPGDLVCDPFLGGGTSAIACMALKRKFIGFDIDAEALKISQDRIAGKNKENLHELPLFRNPENSFTRIVLDGRNGKGELKQEEVNL